MYYGVPYQGSKNLIAKKIIEALPAADTFYDLFGGGCSVTHAAILSGKYKRIVLNDIDGKGIDLFRRAVKGEFKEENRFIERLFYERKI